MSAFSFAVKLVSECLLLDIHIRRPLRQAPFLLVQLHGELCDRRWLREEAPPHMLQDGLVVRRRPHTEVQRADAHALCDLPEMLLGALQHTFKRRRLQFQVSNTLHDRRHSVPRADICRGGPCATSACTAAECGRCPQTRATPS